MSLAVPVELVTRKSPLTWMTVPVRPAVCPITNELVTRQEFVPIRAWNPPLVPSIIALLLVRLALQVIVGKMGLMKLALSAAPGTVFGDQLSGLRKSPPMALVKARSAA